MNIRKAVDWLLEHWLSEDEKDKKSSKELKERFQQFEMPNMLSSLATTSSSDPSLKILDVCQNTTQDSRNENSNAFCLL